MRVRKRSNLQAYQQNTSCKIGLNYSTHTRTERYTIILIIIFFYVLSTKPVLCYFHSKVPSALHCFLLVIVLVLSCKSTVVCYNILPRTSFHHLLESSISWDFFTSFANCVTSSVKWKKNKSVLS